MALLRYAVIDVLRSRRRTISSVLGVLLAISFVAGTFIAIDSSTRATLDALLSNVPGDFGVYATGNASDLRRAVLNVSGVRDLSLYRPIPINGELASDAVPFTRYGEVLAVEPDHLPVRFRDVRVEGSLELPRGTIGLSEEIASSLGVGLGNRVRLLYRTYDFENETETVAALNLTVTAILTFPPTGDVVPGPIIGPPFFGPAAVVHLQDADWITEQVAPEFGRFPTAGEVWIDRDEFIDPYDLETTNRNLARFERQLSLALAPFGGATTNYLGFALSNFSLQIAVQRILFLVLSTPVLLLGLYLAAVGVDLGHAERRRELAVLKARGAGARQVTGLLLLEAVFGGVIAGILGLIAGLVLSRLLLGVVNPFGLASAPRYEDFILSMDTIVTVGVLSVLLMAAVTYRSAKRTSALPIVETLRYYAPGETRIPYRPTADVVMVSLATVTFAGALYSRIGSPGFLLFLLGIIFVVLLPFAPILLVVGTTRLLTRSTGRVYEWTARIFRPVAKNLYHIISRNISRNPRRAANVAVIIALGLAFGIFVFAVSGSQQGQQVRLLRDAVGADVAATWPSPVNETAIISNVSRIPGVAGVSRLGFLDASTGFCCPSFVVLDPAPYFTVAQPEFFYFEGVGAAGIAEILSTRGNVVVSRAFLDQAFLEVGDVVRVQRPVFEPTDPQTEISVTVAGVVKGLPGTSGGFNFPGQIVYGSFETFADLIPPPGDTSRSIQLRFLIDLTQGADWRPAKDAILSEGAISVSVFEEAKASLFDQPAQRAFLGFIGMEMAFVVVILTAGLGLIVFAATLERDVEFAGITARGSSGWQTASLLVGEAFSIMLVGLLVGVGVGLLTAFVTIQVSQVTPGFPPPVVPVFFEIAPEGLILIAVAPAAMLLVALLVSWRIARMNVARVLKLRGG